MDYTQLKHSFVSYIRLQFDDFSNEPSNVIVNIIINFKI